MFVKPFSQYILSLSLSLFFFGGHVVQKSLNPVLLECLKQRTVTGCLGQNDVKRNPIDV